MCIRDRLEAQASVLPQAISEHSPVLADLPMWGALTCARRQCLERVKVRNFKKINYPALIDALVATDWPAPPPGLSPDVILDDIYNLIWPLIDRFAPEKEIRVRRDTPDLLLQPDTVAAMRLRDRARASGDPRYRWLRNRVVCLVRRDRMQTARQALRSSDSQQSAAWKMANSLLSPKQSLPILEGTSTNLESVEAQNHFFLDKVQKLRAGIKQTNSQVNQAFDGNRPSFELHSIGLHTTRRILQHLARTDSVGVDGIPTIF